MFHSTALRGSQFEVKIHVPFLKDGAFIAQSIATYPTARAIRKLGLLQPAHLSMVESAVFNWRARIPDQIIRPSQVRRKSWHYF